MPVLAAMAAANLATALQRRVSSTLRRQCFGMGGKVFTNGTKKLPGFRNAVLDPVTRERLVQDAMSTTGCDRAAAVRRVLDDLHADNRRWS